MMIELAFRTKADKRWKEYNNSCTKWRNYNTNQHLERE